MIETINKAINAKLNSISWTTIVTGVVTNINPLQIRINERIEIGVDFIEPSSLDVDESSPGQPLYNYVVGDNLKMIRYNNGQRFYILGGGGVSDYTALQNKPILNTNNSTSLTPNSDETIIDTISLHKVSKTGSYNDLTNKPSFSNYVTLTGTQTISGKKTFSTLPESSVAPTTNNQLVNKLYVDGLALTYDVLETF